MANLKNTLFLTGLLAGVVWCPELLRAQESLEVPITVHSDAEEYLRVLQGVGEISALPWSIRPFSPSQLRAISPVDSLHPWAGRYGDASGGPRQDRFSILAPESRLQYFTTLPGAGHDGAIWAGRGLTTSISAGFAARIGPLSIAIQPVWFAAQNRDVPLVFNGATDPVGQYADARWPLTIDHPQQFGKGVYSRIDPGQSTVQLDWHGANIGLSTANQHWGPAVEYPIILGDDAPGFPHLFVGPSGPVDLRVATLQARVMWGELSESDLAPPSISRRRLATGFVATLSPKGTGGLELGVTRFFHSSWPEDGLSWRDLTRPFGAVLKVNETDVVEGGDGRTDASNQLASLFFRWPLASSGFEIFGEYGRDDHNWDMRDLLLEPDHESALSLGMAKAWRMDDQHLAMLRIEHAAGLAPAIEMVRPHQPFYVHDPLTQGHTNRGQLLGSAAVFGGSGTVVRIEQFAPEGRTGVELKRTLRESGWKLPPTEQRGNDEATYSLSFEVLQFRGPAEISMKVIPSRILNYGFSTRDRWNFGAEVGVRIH